MQVDLVMQKENQNTLSEAMTAAFLKDPKKAYFLCGNLRETGFKLIEEEIIDRKVKLFFAIGVDKKNTTRSMLEDLLRYTKDVYYYSNNHLVEYDTNISIFEYAGEAIMYVAPSKLSEASMKDDLIVYTKITYDLTDVKEAKEYKDKLKEIIKVIEKETFTKLDKEKIEALIEEKEIFSTRQYMHTVKSISDLLGKTEEAKPAQASQKTDDDVFPSDIEIPKIDLGDMDIDLGDIDVSGVEESIVTELPKEEKIVSDVQVDVAEALEEENIPSLEMDEIEEETTTKEHHIIDEENDLYDENLKDIEFHGKGPLDINDLLFSKADMALDVQEEDIDNEESESDEYSEDELVKVKKVNLNNVSNYIFELPARNSKGQDLTALKIPNYIQKMIPSFFELTDNGKNMEIDGVNYKVRDIKLELVDVKNNQKYTDRNAKMMFKSGQSYLTFQSDVFQHVVYEENDIARMIKLSSDIYHIEFISKEMQEYHLWDKLCTQTLKSTTRKYGMM